MIPQRLELWTYPYQEYALPIKLRNLLPKIIWDNISVYIYIFFCRHTTFNKILCQTDELKRCPFSHLLLNLLDVFPVLNDYQFSQLLSNLLFIFYCISPLAKPCPPPSFSRLVKHAKKLGGKVNKQTKFSRNFIYLICTWHKKK